MVLDERQKQIGKDNFTTTVPITRRQLLSGVVAMPTVAAMYWGYTELKGDPVRCAVIGTGNQGRAHIRSMNPDYLRVVAFADIRPSNIAKARRDLNEKFGSDAAKIEHYEDYSKLLDRNDIEMVIIALPLHLHAPCSIEAMQKGKHVLCEKLMAKTVMQCKEMCRVADEKNRLLAIGHQRHYSYLYANALAIVQEPAIMGDVKHIRAYWHRNQTGAGAEGADTSADYDSWHPPIPDADKNVDFAKYGYDSLAQLVRWRLDAETGGGLMVELGSHQLDAASIFLGKIHPKCVQGVGELSFFRDGRDVNDHVFLTYEFPDMRGAKDDQGNPLQSVVVTYSSISTNAFDGYGEEVMGTKATLIVQQEHDAYLFQEPAKYNERADYSNTPTRITWAENRMARPTSDSGSTTQWVSGTGTPDTLTSRGYREEQEHMAWIIRNPDSGQKPRCNGKVALGDAVVTLASNLAMAKKRRIEYKKEWFEVDSDSVPENEI
jgi:predicted dehydrogenase